MSYALRYRFEAYRDGVRCRLYDAYGFGGDAFQAAANLARAWGASGDSARVAINRLMVNVHTPQGDVVLVCDTDSETVYAGSGPCSPQS